MSFLPKTPKLQQLAEMFPDKIQELESIFLEHTNIYIDRANVYGRKDKLGWNIDLMRLYQLLRSFSTIEKIRWYQGTLVGNKDSEKAIAKAVTLGYDVTTKPVKIMKHSIDMTSITDTKSPAILRTYISNGLLSHLPSTSIEIFNQELQKLNQQGIKSIEEKKCNFDVEIGVDMILDDERSPSPEYYRSYILWSGDSDFTDIVQKLISTGKNVFVFATARRVSRELSQSGAIIFDIQKIRDFICRNKHMTVVLSDPLLP